MNPVSINAFIDEITNKIIVDVLTVAYEIVHRTTRDRTGMAVCKLIELPRNGQEYLLLRQEIRTIFEELCQLYLTNPEEMRNPRRRF